MSVEYWGTFSVRDHLAPRAFVADILLYDRLLIPTLAEGDPVDSWETEWDLARQQTLLGHLGEFGIPFPWNSNRRAQFDEDFAGEQRRRARAEVTQFVEQDAADVRRYDDTPYGITRRILMDFVNREADDLLLRRLRVQQGALPGSTVRAFTAYPSYAGFAADLPADGAAGEDHNLSPSAAFGWQFFVPESADTSPDEDRRLLDKAMGLARKPEFVERRRDFYLLWEDIRNARYSPEDAKSLMETRLADYQKYMRGERWKKRACYAMGVVPLLVPVFGAAGATFAGASALAIQWFSASAGLFLGGAAIPVKNRLAAKPPPPAAAGAAMFHDARRRLGWKAPR